MMKTRSIYQGQTCPECGNGKIIMEATSTLVCDHCNAVDVSPTLRYAPYTPKDGRREIVELVSPLLRGSALTVPFRGKTYVIYKNEQIMMDYNFEFIRVHEQCHVEDIELWGAKVYLWRHLLARNFMIWRTVPCSDVERDCYKRANQVTGCD